MMMTEMVDDSASSEPAPRRFAPKGARQAPQDARLATKQSYVFLRVKRKRHEDPVECLLVQGGPEVKRPHVASEQSAASDSSGEPAKPHQDQLLAAFTKLSTKDRGFVFKRIDTLESHQLDDANHGKWAERLKKKAKSLKATERVHAKKLAADKSALALAQGRAQQQQARLKERRKSEVQRTRGLAPTEMTEHKTLELPGVRMVELATVASAQGSGHSVTRGGDGVSMDGDAVMMNGAALQSRRVLNPYERELDEAVWQAFQLNDFSVFFRIFYTHRPELRVDPAAFQRPADGGTVLMAAAMHGRADVIEAVLRSSAASVVQQDWNGATAAAFARQGGHAEIEKALLACEAAEHEKEFVYDVYCVDMAASAEHDSGAVGGDRALSGAPVVSVSSAVQRWLSQEAGSAAADDAEDVEEFMLESDADSNDDDNESIDSNDENYAFNDYPDEESGESDYDSDDSEERSQRMPSNKPRREDEQICADSYDY